MFDSQFIFQFIIEELIVNKQKKITDFFNIFNQDKNVDSNVESSSVIQNDQAKSKYGDHDDDTTLKLFVTTSSSYDICEGKTQHGEQQAFYHVNKFHVIITLTFIYLFLFES